MLPDIQNQILVKEMKTAVKCQWVKWYCEGANCWHGTIILLL